MPSRTCRLSIAGRQARPRIGGRNGASSAQARVVDEVSVQGWLPFSSLESCRWGYGNPLCPHGLGLPGIGQGDQQIGNLCVPAAQPRAAAITAFANPKGPPLGNACPRGQRAGRRDGDPPAAPRQSRPPIARQGDCAAICPEGRGVDQRQMQPFAAGQRMAASFFSERLFEQIRLHADASIHPLQPPVLVLKGFHLADHGGICHPAGFCVAKAREGMPPYFARHL